MGKVENAVCVGQPTSGPLAKTLAGPPIAPYTANVPLGIARLHQPLGKAHLECRPCPRPYLYGYLASVLAGNQSSLLLWLVMPIAQLMLEWTENQLLA